VPRVLLNGDRKRKLAFLWSVLVGPGGILERGQKRKGGHMNFFGWKRAISFVFAALATLEIAAAPAQDVQTVTVAPGQSVTVNSKGEVQKQGAPQGQTQAQGQPAAQPQGQSKSKAQPQGQATGQAFTQQQLDELLAPIALYPDALLGQVLAASKNP
jgi:hypothetical protein